MAFRRPLSWLGLTALLLVVLYVASNGVVVRSGDGRVSAAVSRAQSLVGGTAVSSPGRLPPPRGPRSVEIGCRQRVAFITCRVAESEFDLDPGKWCLRVWRASAEGAIILRRGSVRCGHYARDGDPLAGWHLNDDRRLVPRR
jgi:hypothetical protein